MHIYFALILIIMVTRQSKLRINFYLNFQLIKIMRRKKGKEMHVKPFRFLNNISLLPIMLNLIIVLDTHGKEILSCWAL
jgi:ACR3 family arsenite efflux pump ArsB